MLHILVLFVCIAFEYFHFIFHVDTFSHVSIRLILANACSCTLLLLLRPQLRLLFAIAPRFTTVQALPYLVEEDLSPTWFKACRTRFLDLALDQLVLDGFGTLSAFQHVGVNVLARRVGAQGFRTHGKVFSKTSVPVAVAALESGIPNRALGASDKAIGFSKQAWFHLAHQKVHVRWNHFHIVWIHNVSSQRMEVEFLAATFFFCQWLLLFA